MVRQSRRNTNELAGRVPIGICAVLLLLTVIGETPAQVTSSKPDTAYFVGVEELYSGDPRSASRIFRREFNGAIRVGTTRWVDSICYHAMQGEVAFQMGDHAEAMAHFDQACQLFLQNPSWMNRVRFQSQPRADTNRIRGPAPPWGRSERQATLGDLPGSMLVFHGRVQTAEEIQSQQLTVIETPQFFQMQVPEIVRCTALAIRRRNAILGPLGQHDRISKDLVDTLSRGGLAPVNHWSSAWIELQLALAQVGVGNVQEAHTHLTRALLLDGRFDHPLTCVALLEQGRLALEAGNGPLAARLLAEASFSGFYYENWNVIDEALRLGQLNHLISGGPGVYPPLDAAAEWARRKGMRMLTADFRIAQGENHAVLGQTQAAAAALDDASRWLGQFSGGKAGTRHLFAQSLVGFQNGDAAAAEKTLTTAATRQAAASLRGFQLQRTNLLFDGSEGGRISARVAVGLYRDLLADPTELDWSSRPLDTLALMSLPLADSFDRWMVATLGRKEFLEAVEISELAKRRRFHAAQPWGGRLLALRTLLESPALDMPGDAALQRQQLLVDFPRYQQLTTAGTQIERQLAALPVLAEDRDEHAQLTELYKGWQKNVAQREQLLRLMGLSRKPAQFMFPPLIDRKRLQAELTDGQLIVVFHSVAGQLHGFLISGDDYHHWSLGRTRDVEKDVAELLRELGNYGPGRTFSPNELTDGRWRKAAHTAYQQLFADSRLDVAKTTELIIVPDGLLWYLPFDALLPSDGDDSSTLSEMVPIRYAPTIGLAVGDHRGIRRVQRTGIVANDTTEASRESYFETGIERIAEVATGPVRLPMPLPVPGSLVAARLEQLVSLDEIKIEPAAPLGWSPLPRGRGRGGGLVAMMDLPWAGPERVILAGASTLAESGLKSASRRSASAALLPGNELFQATCGLMASGAQTVLVSRWRTGGQTNLNLVREFLQELGKVPASEAWYRATLVARSMPLDASSEPRLKPADVDAAQQPTADHPFFWAGYLLVDTGRNPAQTDEDAPPEDEPPVVKIKPAD